MCLARNPVSRALAAPGASERLFDFGGARQVPAVIRGSCAAGCPRPPSASLDPHSGILRPHGFRRGGHDHQLVHSVHVHAAGGLSARAYTCALGLREAPTAAQAAHQGTTTSASSPAPFHTVIQVQLLPRRVLVRRNIVRLSDLDQPWSTLSAYSFRYANGIAVATQSAPDTNQHRAATSKSEGRRRGEGGGHRSSQL